MGGEGENTETETTTTDEPLWDPTKEDAAEQANPTDPQVKDAV